MAETLAELLAGADMEGWEAFCNKAYNNLKNHWRQLNVKAALTSVVAGMIASDATDEKLWHRLAASWSEILQGAVNSNIIDDIQLAGGTDLDTILILYEETTNDAVIWGLPVDPKRGLIFCDVADIAGDLTAVVASQFPQIALVDLDLDSYIALTHRIDDCPTIITGGGSNLGLNIQAAGGKLGFFDIAPVVRAAAIADATGAGDVVLRLNDVIHALEDYGLLNT